MAQREERLQRDRERRRERRAAETPSEREERLQRDRERSHAKRAAESTEEREARLRRERDRRAAETPEQREVHECQSVEPQMHTRITHYSYSVLPCVTSLRLAPTISLVCT